MNHREVLSAESIDALERGYFKALRVRDQLRAALEGIIDRYDDDKANGTDWFTILDADRAALGGGK